MLVPVVRERVYFADAGHCLPDDGQHRVISMGEHFKYCGYCDDFGPMNLATIMAFVKMLEMELCRFPGHKIVCVAEQGRRNVTNCVFLVGAYMILVRKASPEAAWKCFEDRYRYECYRDATFSVPDFGLTLLDCWRGLASGQALGWIGATPDESMYDLEEYEHYDNPANGELHIVVPNKFVAFRGPANILGDMEYEDVGGCRNFSAGYYIDIFKELGVSTIIRLNERVYDNAIFESAGFEHHDLVFDDCTAPPNDIVAQFMRIVDQAPGMIAVHCKAGLGRTGTLIALFLMLAHGFGARDAMGWLRIVRPGCVIGEQQQYLCQIEDRLHMATNQPQRQAAKEADGGQDLPSVESLTLSPQGPSRSAEQARQVSDALRRHARDRYDTTAAIRPCACR